MVVLSFSFVFLFFLDDDDDKKTTKRLDDEERAFGALMRRSTISPFSLPFEGKGDDTKQVSSKKGRRRRRRRHG